MPGQPNTPAAFVPGESVATNPSPGQHTPVLVNEVLSLLAPVRGDVVLDCTAGLGGHAVAMAQHMAQKGRAAHADTGTGSPGTIALVDADAGNLACAADRVRSEAFELSGRLASSPPGTGSTSGLRVETLHASFVAAPRWLSGLGLSANAVLADLGFCSNQVEDATRGFSFQRDGPLDMRLNRGGVASGTGSESGGGSARVHIPLGPTAAELVNTLPEAELATILRDFGEEPAARPIATKIVWERAREPIETTQRLVEIVHSVVRRRPGRGGGGGGMDPATKTFQALRIAVNDELGALQALLDQIDTAATALAASGRAGRGSGGETMWLAPGARIAFITFHSLEDRPVKQRFASLIERGLAESMTPHRSKPMTATDDETRSNPRSRSAKLRAIRLLP